MRIKPCGREAVLIETSSQERSHLVRAFRTFLPDTKIVPAAETVLIYCDPSRIDEILASLPTDLEQLNTTVSTVTVEVTYSGPDLARAADLAGLSPEALVQWHTSTQWHADFAGFSPGFMYLTPSEPLIDFPRLDSPRAQIPAGSVGLGGLFSGIYPQESPGGWNIIGFTSAPLWDIQRPSPALISPGDIVLFKGVL